MFGNNLLGPFSLLSGSKQGLSLTKILGGEQVKHLVL